MDSGDPKNPNPEYLAAVESVAGMQVVLEPVLAVAPDCFAAAGKCAAFFRLQVRAVERGGGDAVLQNSCVVLSTEVEGAASVSSAVWSLTFSGALEEAPPIVEAPGDVTCSSRPQLSQASRAGT